MFPIDPKTQSINQLISAVADFLQPIDQPGELEDTRVSDALNACDLQPTSRARHLAATAAVAVLLAHEIGQEVAADTVVVAAPLNGHKKFERKRRAAGGRSKAAPKVKPGSGFQRVPCPQCKRQISKSMLAVHLRKTHGLTSGKPDFAPAAASG